MTAEAAELELKTLRADNEGLRQQLIALDRIVEGRRISSSGLASESSILQAPFLEVHGLFDYGMPQGPVVAVRSRLEMEFHGPDGGYSNFLFSRQSNHRPVPIGRLTAESRVVLAILGAPR